MFKLLPYSRHLVRYRSCVLVQTPEKTEPEIIAYVLRFYLGVRSQRSEREEKWLVGQGMRDTAGNGP